MKAISGLDATFLYAESPTSHMHVGSVIVIEGSLNYEDFKSLIRSKLHMMPILRKRLVFVPMSIDYPYWVDDPNFDIDTHIHHIALPKPGDWKHLRRVASQIFSEQLDRSKPLWSMHFVEGIDKIAQVPKGSVALITKTHHVAIDGMSGAGMLALIADVNATKKELKAPAPFTPASLPSEASVIMKSAMTFAKNPFKLPRIIAETVTSTVKAGVLTRVQSRNLPSVPFSAPRTPLNGIIASSRKWNTAILSLDRIKVLKSKMGTTINDVILAICAGALRKYLVEKDRLPQKPLVAMVPVSTRDKGDNSNEGNQVSSMLVQLATNIEDPIERLKVIQENTVRGKIYQGALGAKTLSNLAETVPFAVANQAAKAYSRFNLAKMHSPVFNVVITNVPGPQLPLYIHGHKISAIMGMAPIFDGMGLIITVLSYNGQVTISPTSDSNSMPDINLFSEYLRDSANELEALILAQSDKKPGSSKRKSTKKAAPASDALFNHIKKYLKENPTFLKPNSGIYQVNVTGPTPAVWQLNFNKPPGSVRRGEAKNADLELTIDDKHLVKLGKGTLGFQTAFIQGRIKVKGDTSKGMRFGKILSLIPNL